MNQKPLIGISTCLLGENVRYDGGHKLDRYLRDTLGMYVEFVPVCPEVECGMTIPREALDLVFMNGTVHLMTQKTKTNMTPRMNKWMHKKIAELSDMPLCGFILKSKSPSCGLLKVKVFKENDGFYKNGVGIFAKGLTDRFPLLPVEEEGRLHDNRLRENFIERIFVMQRWHKMIEERKSLNNVMDFHARHKYILMAHCPKTLRALGAGIAQGKLHPIKDVYEGYFRTCMAALGKIATVKKNTNVLQHIMGYFRNNLTKDEKEELQDIITGYHEELFPLIVPITLLNHYVRKYRPRYLEEQMYLNPHPMELMLRNHV
jgi:uncharacterized protein YbgA (DUF1722 family)/uncharacterized protein YbbK (DUF523 family)